MNPKDRFLERVRSAEKEARRFLDCVVKWDQRSEYSNKESAAMKRASMDLTRALADVRRSRYEETK